MGTNHTTQVQARSGTVLPLSALVLSPTNPRTIRDDAAQRELVESVRAKGIIFPLLARPSDGGKFEIVSGSRRFQAAKTIGLVEVPVDVRDLSDREVREIQIIENLQRADLHFLDEAKAYSALLEIDPTVTAEVVAEKVGKSKAYVHARLSLNRLVPKLTNLCRENKVSVGVALSLARLTATIQQAALEYLDPRRRNQTGTITAGDIQDFLERQVYVDLKRAPFDTTSADLVPTVGGCTTCPKQAGNSPMLFPEIKQKATCSDPNCFQSKCAALVQITQKEYPGALKIIVGHPDYEDLKRAEKRKDLVPMSEYGEAGWRQSASGACEFTKDAVVVMGDTTTLGQHKLVCVQPKCPVHSTRRSSGGSLPHAPGIMNEERRKQVEELWQRRTRHAVRIAVHAAVRNTQAKDKDPFRSMPLEVLRFVVRECAYALKPMQDGMNYFEGLWPLPKGAKASDDYRSGHLDKLIGGAVDRPALIKILTDLVVAQDVAGKFSEGTNIVDLGKAYLVNLKQVAAPVEKEWAEKKRVSYAKRAARLAAEKKRVAKKAKPAAAGKAKPSKAAAAPGTCRHCGCTESTPCIVEVAGGGGTCSWTDKSKTVCSTRKCRAAEAKRKAPAKKGKAKG